MTTITGRTETAPAMQNIPSREAPERPQGFLRYRPGPKKRLILPGIEEIEHRVAKRPKSRLLGR